ncbi:hypothetical protein SAY86_017964 [Trapa natans]|uniref:G domain-containing protein n=1 Tax=Trapa natans TaxID=22666 RepID=A0AAN7M748_TRANT|nr:hypothetical protein SAY86_017964 [Trapa natans]
MGIIEKIKGIEAEMAQTQKNKATVPFRSTQSQDSKAEDTIVGPFKVSDLHAFDEANNSNLVLFIMQCGEVNTLTMVTGTHSKAASYELTTLTCNSGIIHYNDTKIQLLDLPGIIEGASEGTKEAGDDMPKHFLCMLNSDCFASIAL